MHGRCASHLTDQKGLRLLLFSKTHWMFPAISVDVYTGLIGALWRSKVSSMIHARPNRIRSLTATFVRLPLQWELCKVIMHIKSIVLLRKQPFPLRFGHFTIYSTQPKAFNSSAVEFWYRLYEESYTVQCVCVTVLLSCF